MLVGDFDYGAGNDDLFDGQVLGGGGLGGLFAIKVRERGSEVGCIVIQVILGFRGGYCGNGAVVCRCARCGSRRSMLAGAGRTVGGLMGLVGGGFRRQAGVIVCRVGR